MRAQVNPHGLVDLRLIVERGERAMRQGPAESPAARLRRSPQALPLGGCEHLR